MSGTTRGDALLPCPFCGHQPNDAAEAGTHLSFTGSLDASRLLCRRCGAQGPTASASGPALAAWNRRALPTGADVLDGEREREFVDRDVIVDEHGTHRFRANPIVRHLLDHGGIDMNALARLDFPDWARREFAQMIGYSVSGYGELQSYVDDAAYERAQRASERLRAPSAPVGEERERLANEITNVRHLTLIHEGDEVRPASLSYVKPSEYQRQVNALLDRIASIVRSAPVGTTNAGADHG